MNSANYELTARAIPSIIFRNKDFFIKTILPSPTNMRRFISDDVWKKVCETKGIPYEKIEVSLSGRKTANNYSIVFVDFGESFAVMPTESKMLAFAVKGEDLRYFTCEKGEDVLDKSTRWFIGGWEITEQGKKHLNFGSDKEMSMVKFATKIDALLTQ